MVEVEERELLLQSFKAYLEELRDSGVDELYFAAAAVSNEPRQELSAAAPRDAEPAPPGQGTEDPCQGVGNPRARLLFVMTGAGFAGEAGNLLANMIKGMKFATSEVYLLTFTPRSDAAGSPSRQQLMRRIEAVRPEVVVALGEPAAQLLLETEEPVATLRGRFHDLGGISLMPTLHPDAMLADQGLKREVWNEMQQVMLRLSQPR